VGVLGIAWGATAGLGVTFGQIAMIGVSMVFSGVAGLLSSGAPTGKEERATDRARPDDRPSFVFNGVTNNSQQGGPVPIVCGRHLVGSVVIDGGLAVEDIDV
jgi:predicted phage tail protein